MAIPAERLREGQQILVKGKTSFSRLAQLVEGEALAKSIEQARSRGSLYPTTVPHTTINIVDAQVLPADPANPTPEEQFTQEKIYTLKSGDNAGKLGFGIDNKSSILPTVLEPDPEAPGAYRQVILERDLAAGLDVILVLQVFKPKTYEKRGLGLQQIVLQEPVKYYGGGADVSALAARGIVVNGPIRTVTAADAPAIDPAVAAAEFVAEAARAEFPVPANTGVVGGLPVPTPGAQGIAPAPVQQAFPVSAPVVAPIAQAPVAAPAATPVETPEQQIARLQAQIEEQKAAMSASGGASAFDAAPVATPVGAPSPWEVPGQGPATYQG